MLMFSDYFEIIPFIQLVRRINLFMRAMNKPSLLDVIFYRLPSSNFKIVMGSKYQTKKMMALFCLK